MGTRTKLSVPSEAIDIKNNYKLISKYITDVKSILDDDGIFVVQLGYMPLMMELNEFGYISHEHLCYYTFKNLIDEPQNS